MSSTPPSAVSLKLTGPPIKWINKWKLFSSEDDNKWLKWLLIGSSVTTLMVGTVLWTRRYLTISRDEKHKSIVNGNIRHQNSQYYDCRSPGNEELDHFVRSPSSSTGTLVGVNTSAATAQPPAMGQTLDLSSLDGLGGSKLTSCVFPSDRRMRRLSWKSTSSLAARSGVVLSPFQIVSIASDSLASTTNLIENMQNRLLAGGDGTDMTALNRLNELLDKLKLIEKEISDLKGETNLFTSITNEEQDDDDTASVFSASTMTGYWDVEPNLHFFKMYQNALENLSTISPTRVDRTQQVGCESEDEFRAKVGCIREAFTKLFETTENQELFISMGKEILEILVRHSMKDPSTCLSAYTDFLNYVADIDNHEQISFEVSRRSINVLSFYDIVLDYIIMESLDDLENPPAAVAAVANNRWLSASIRETALQTAVSAVMRHKRSRLVSPDGFFAHFYAVLDVVSPILAWGFLGTDQDLKLKCLLIKESLMETIRDYFSFDRVRFTNLNDLCEDILRVTRERYWELNNKLSILTT